MKESRFSLIITKIYPDDDSKQPATTVDILQTDLTPEEVISIQGYILKLKKISKGEI